jgi:hypothetical protein
VLFIHVAFSSTFQNQNDTMGGGLALVTMYAVTEHVIVMFSILFVIQNVCLCP